MRNYLELFSWKELVIRVILGAGLAMAFYYLTGDSTFSIILAILLTRWLRS